MPNTTLEKVTDYFSDARTQLQDMRAPYRYDDQSLLTALNVTLLETRRLRPDLFIYRKRLSNEPAVPAYALNSGGTDAGNTNVPDALVPIEEPFRLAILHGMIGHVLERDQEDIQDARAGAFMKIFNDILLGVRPSPISTGGGQGAQ